MRTASNSINSLSLPAMKNPFRQKSNFLWACLFIVPVIGLWQVTFMQYSMKWDMLDFFYPWRFHIGEMVQQGLLPLWNPYQNLGYPIYADPQGGAWYPVTWLVSLMGGYSLTAIHLEYVLHVLVAGAGMYGLANYLLKDKLTAVIIAVAFQGCGIFIGNAQHLSWIISAAWTPFVLHYFLLTVRTLDYKYAVLTGLFMALMMTGGYPVFSLILHYFLFLFILFLLARRIGGKANFPSLRFFSVLTVAYSLFLTIAAGYLYSFLEVMPFITRSDFTFEEAQQGAYTLKSLLSLVFPFATAKGTEWFGLDVSMVSIYFGLFPLLFLLFSFFAPKPKYYWPVFALGILALMIALAQLFPFRDWLFHYVPLMDTFRFAALFRFFAIIAFLLLAGIGLRTFLRHPGENRNMLLAIAAVLFSGILITVIISFLKYPHPWLPPFWDPAQFLGAMEVTVIYQHLFFQGLIQLCLLAAFLFLIWKKPLAKQWQSILLVLVLVDIILATQLNVPVTVVSENKAATVQERMEGLPKGFPVPGMGPVAQNTDQGLWIAPMWHNLNTLYKRPSFLGFNSFKLSAYDRFLESGHRDSVLQNPLIFFTGNSGELTIRDFHPTKMTINARAGIAGTLVLLQNHYRGWTATINGKPAPIGKAYGTFMKIEVPAGRHEVVFQYSRPLLLPLYIVSFLGILLACFLYLWGVKKGTPHDSTFSKI